MTSSEKNSLPADKLKHAEEKINRLMENLPGMAYSCRIVPEWTMVILSKGCLTLTGYSPEDLIENKVLSYRDLIHPEDREYVWQNVSAAVNSDVFLSWNTE